MNSVTLNEENVLTLKTLITLLGRFQISDLHGVLKKVYYLYRLQKIS